MSIFKHCLTVPLIILISFLQKCSNAEQTTLKKAAPKDDYYHLKDFYKLKKYDTHVHINVEDTTLIKQAEADNFRLLTVNVTPAYYPSIEEQQRIATRLVDAYPGRLAYATSFSLENWNNDDWQQKTLAYLQESFKKGAIAVKVWKNVGMELKDSAGRFIMIDNVKFEAVLQYLEKNKIPLLGHLGEPRNAWLPLAEMNIKGNQHYFSKHPEYHMYLHPEYPSYQDQVQARDRMLEQHPGLQFIGAHLGSLEWSTDELGKRLDRFPNMAVDMAARLSSLQFQCVDEWQKVRNFFVKYQDRLIYATDIEAGGTINPPQLRKRIHDSWMNDWNFFVGDSTMHSTGFDAAFKGLRLPRTVVDKIYHANAEKWFPGINKRG